MTSLAGRVALVTGGTRNLGRAAVEALAAHGADIVVVTGSSPERAQTVVDEVEAAHGVRASYVVADISDPEQVGAAVRQAGRVDIAVEAAAIRRHTPVLDIGVDEWNQVLATNLSAVFYFARALLPGMIERRWGRLIHVGGADGFVGGVNRAHAVAARAGVQGLTKALAAEAGPHGITVNSIVLGAFRTERDEAPYPGWTEARAAEAIPVGRIGDVAEFGAMCVHLASDDAGYITGQALHMNGGRWMF